MERVPVYECSNGHRQAVSETQMTEAKVRPRCLCGAALGTNPVGTLAPGEDE